jgi:hypothetical protein
MPDYSTELQKNSHDISGAVCKNCDDDHLYDYALGFTIVVIIILIKKILRRWRK